MNSLLIYRRREYTQTEWMLMLLTVFLFITAWNPQNILYPKCYLFFYTVYLHLRKYPTFNSFKFFNFLLPVTFLFKNNNIQVFKRDVKCSSSFGHMYGWVWARQTFAIHKETRMYSLYHVHYFLYEAKHRNITESDTVCCCTSPFYQRKQIKFKQPNHHMNGL